MADDDGLCLVVTTTANNNGTLLTAPNSQQISLVQVDNAQASVKTDAVRNVDHQQNNQKTESGNVMIECDGNGDVGGGNDDNIVGSNVVSGSETSKIDQITDVSKMLTMTATVSAVTATATTTITSSAAASAALPSPSIRATVTSAQVLPSTSSVCIASAVATDPSVGDTKLSVNSAGNNSAVIANNNNNNNNNNNKQMNSISIRGLNGLHTATANATGTGAVGSGKSTEVPGLTGVMGNLKPPARNAKDIDDIRKKRRCTDRYDSSESSDSGVATLSCTDSSTASSDASDPGSPYSPSSCDDNNPSNGQQRTVPHQWPWNNTATTTPTATTVSTNNNNNNNTTNNNNTNNNNNNKRTLGSETAVTIKKVRSNSDKTGTASTKKPVIITRHKAIDDNATVNPQTKITGFFKSQIKPINGLKRDLTNMVVRSKDFPKIEPNEISSKKSCDYDVRTLTGVSQSVKKVERKTAKVAPLVPISRKSSTGAGAKKPIFPATTKKPVTIAPRAIEPKRIAPPQLVPKLQEIRKKPIEQPKLSQPTVLLTTIRIPQQQVVAAQSQSAQAQPIAQNVQPKTPTKLGSMFQLHSGPVMPKLVQIPNILGKDTNLVVNNGHIARVNNGPHYFLNGAVIKLQPISEASTVATTATNGITATVESTINQNMLLKTPTLAATVPFTSKALPLQQQQAQAPSQSQVQNQTFAPVATATYAQPVFMATSSGLLLSTALPTVITSQLSGIQTINQQTAISALHQYNHQTSANVLPSINTILQQTNQHHPPQTATFVSSQSSFHLQTTHQQTTHLNHQATSLLSNNIPTASPLQPPQQLPVTLSTTATSPASIGKLAHFSVTSTCLTPLQQQFTTISTLPPLITSTPTTSITTSCISPIESSPIKSIKLEVPELAQISLNIETAQPTVPVFHQHFKDTKSKAITLDLPTSTSICVSKNTALLPPKLEPICFSDNLPSPKSLVLEKIQQKKLEGLDDETTILKKLPGDLLIKVPVIETEFQTNNLQESAKSPILSQPKTIRFPAVNAAESRSGNRKSDGRIIGVCYWDNCSAKYDTSSKLLDHLQTQHVNIQSGPFMCQWSGCKVHGRESCSRRWLERHVLSHGGTKPFKCIVEGCGLRFGSQLALQKHVNGHFNTTETKDQTTKRSSDPPVPKKLRMNGKRLRYRRQPFSARMFDYFDGGAMEVLQHRLAHTATTANGPGGSVHFTGQQMARRITSSGTIELLIKWTPSNIISDEWIAQSNVTPTKTIKVQSMSPLERISLLRYLRKSYKNSDFTNSTISSTATSSSILSSITNHHSQSTTSVKHYRKPPKTQPS